MSIKKLIAILLCVILAVVGIDRILNALIANYVKTKSFPGDYEKIDYMMKQCDAPFLLVGASQCSCSFVSDMFETQLDTSVFNCGTNAQTAEFFDVILDGIIRRKPPKQVLLVLRSMDLMSKSTDRLTIMNIYYGAYTPLLDKYLAKGDLFHKIRLKSSLLRINTHWWRILLYHFITFNEMGNKGFIPKPVRELHPQQKITFDKQQMENIKEIEPEKREVLDHIVQNCKNNNINLFIVFPPTMVDYEHHENPYSKLLQEYCQEKQITFFDDSQLTQIADNPDLFYDEFHLNENGAKAYTTFFLEKYKDLMKSNDNK